MPIQGVKFYSWGPGGGYGDAAKAYMLGLARRGIPVTWSPLVLGVKWASRGLGFEPYSGTICDDPELEPFVNRPIPYDIVVGHMVPEYYPTFVEVEPGKKVVGYTVWETDKIPAHWPPLLNAVDHLMVPCGWNRQVFRECGIHRPIDVVPHILPDSSGGGPDEGEPLLSGVSDEDFIFFTIGTWTTRKAIWNTVRAFQKAFTKDDPAVLVIKTTARDLSQRQRILDFWKRLVIIGLHLAGKKEWVPGFVEKLEPFRARTRDALGRLKEPGGPRIILCTDEWPRQKIENLHRRGDCFVSLCNAEGWGLGAFEAAGFGKPVIITGYGGQLDYLPSDLAYLVDYRMVSVVDPTGGRSYTPDQHWAEPDLDHAAALMRRVFSRREDARERAIQLRDQVLKRFSEEAVMDKMIGVLKKL